MGAQALGPCCLDSAPPEPLTSCKTLSTLFALCVSQFANCKTRIMIMSFTGLLCEWNERIHAYCLLQCPRHCLKFSHSVVSNSLWTHGLQHTSLPCPSPTPGACSNSYQLSQWCHPTISSSVIPFSSSPQSFFPSIRVFSNKSALCIRGPKNWSFSFNISPSNEQLGLISFRMDWLDLLAVQGALKSLLQHHTSKASIRRCSAFFTSNSHIHTWPLEKP